MLQYGCEVDTVPASSTGTIISIETLGPEHSSLVSEATQGAKKLHFKPFEHIYKNVCQHSQIYR
jgi:hypothetical protein